MAAGLAMLELISNARLLRAAGARERGARGHASSTARDAAGVPLRVQRVGSMLTPFFQRGPGAQLGRRRRRSDTQRFARFHRELLARGVYWPPSQYEAGFVSIAHDDGVLERTEAALRAALASARDA